jgi:chromosome segregation ATPase
MKLILFFEELILLKSMESKDISLTKRLASCRQEKGQILKEINEISRKLKDKKKEIDEIKEKEEDLMVRFHELVPERDENYEKCRKFFERIIKRKRRIEKPEKGEGEEEDEDEEAEEEEEVEEDDDEDEDEDNDLAGLDPDKYKIEDMEKLREDRLDLYEEKEKILQFISDLDNQRRRLENKERAIKQDLEETEEEIQDF